MTTVDRRTRFDGDARALSPAEWLFVDLPAILDDTGTLGSRGVAVLGLAPLSFQVDGVDAHLAVHGQCLEVRKGLADDGPIAMLDAAAFSDLVQDVASTFGLTMAGRVEMRRDTADAFIAWEPVLRALLDRRPVHEPGSVTFHGRDGRELDLHQSFRLDDPVDNLGHFLAETGYLHLPGVFSEGEMAKVSAELDDAVARATRDDGASWWARTEDDGWYPSRILGFNLASPTLRELLSGDRFRAIGQLTGDQFVQRDPHIGDSAEGLWKKIGVVEGISDVSWHKDCSPGGHSRQCCALTVGISVTGSTAGSGELGVVAGSNRANVQPTGVRSGLDLPRVALPTRTGDLTIHCSCTLHMSRPPVECDRRVVYTGFDLAKRPGDEQEVVDEAEIRRGRASLSEAGSRLQRRTDFGNDVDTFTLE